MPSSGKKKSSTPSTFESPQEKAAIVDYARQREVLSAVAKNLTEVMLNNYESLPLECLWRLRAAIRLLRDD